MNKENKGRYFIDCKNLSPKNTLVSGSGKIEKNKKPKITNNI